VCDDCPEPDLDTLTRAELAELDPMYLTVVEALDQWHYRGLGVGTFLDLLAAKGYRVTPIEVSEILLPPPTE